MMHGSTVLTARTLVVVGVVTLLPVLALPPINDLVNRWIRNEAVSAVERTAASAPRKSLAGTVAVVTSGSVPAPQPAAEPPASRDARRSSSPPAWDPQRTAVIQEELKALGANYMLLEQSPGKLRYRFYCRLAVADNAVYTRAFEASDTSAQVAMERVLADVRQWRQRSQDFREQPTSAAQRPLPHPR